MANTESTPSIEEAKYAQKSEVTTRPRDLRRRLKLKQYSILLLLILVLFAVPFALKPIPLNE